MKIKTAKIKWNRAQFERKCHTLVELHNDDMIGVDVLLQFLGDRLQYKVPQSWFIPSTAAVAVTDVVAYKMHKKNFLQC